MLRTAETDKIELLKNKIEKDPKIIALYQFGSSIQGKLYQDIDLCLFNKSKMSLDEKQNYLLYLSEHYDLSFFEDLPLYIKHEVLKGNILLIKDYDALYDIVFKFIRTYRDFEPHFNQFLELIEKC